MSDHNYTPAPIQDDSNLTTLAPAHLTYKREERWTILDGGTHFLGFSVAERRRYMYEVHVDVGNKTLVVRRAKALSLFGDDWLPEAPLVRDADHQIVKRVVEDLGLTRKNARRTFEDASDPYADTIHLFFDDVDFPRAIDDARRCLEHTNYCPQNDDCWDGDPLMEPQHQSRPIERTLEALDDSISVSMRGIRYTYGMELSDKDDDLVEVTFDSADIDGRITFEWAHLDSFISQLTAAAEEVKATIGRQSTVSA